MEQVKENQAVGVNQKQSVARSIESDMPRGIFDERILQSKES